MSEPAKTVKETIVVVVDKTSRKTTSITGPDRRAVCDEALKRVANPRLVGQDLGGFVEGRVDRVSTPNVDARETERVP